MRPKWVQAALLGASVLWACAPTPPTTEAPTEPLIIEAEPTPSAATHEPSFDGDASEALWRAAKKGDLALVTQLVQRTDVNLEFSKVLEYQKDWQQSGFTPLAHAVLRRDEAMMKLLLQHGALIADVVVIAAVQAGDAALVESLVSLGASPQAVSAGLGYACYVQELALIRKLLDLGADVNTIGYWGEIGRTCLGFAAIDFNQDMIELLLAAKADLEAHDQVMHTAFLAAISSGSLDGASYLVKRGARSDVRDENGETALHWAVRDANLEAVKWLLARKADPNARNNWGETPIFMAHDDEALPCLEALIKAGADADARNDSGESAVDRMEPDAALRRYLLDKGARPS
jgi:ankyrin repeat protein